MCAGAGTRLGPSRSRTRARTVAHSKPIALCKLPDQGARCIGEEGKSFGQIGTRGEFGVRNEIDQNAVKQVDVIGPEISRPEQEQFGDPAGCLGTTLGIAMFDEFIKPRDQRRGKCHQTHSNPSKPQETPRNPKSSTSFRAI
jgi:hypothetical protein